jgi:hypothetical protein
MYLSPGPKEPMPPVCDRHNRARPWRRLWSNRLSIHNHPASPLLFPGTSTNSSILPTRDNAIKFSNPRCEKVRHHLLPLLTSLRGQAISERLRRDDRVFVRDARSFRARTRVPQSLQQSHGTIHLRWLVSSARGPQRKYSSATVLSATP